MKSKPLPLSICLKACQTYDSSIDYTEIYKSIILWLERKEGRVNREKNIK